MTVAASTATAPPATKRAPGALRRLAVRLSSPWVSLTLLGVVFIHQAVGSAGFVVRQHFEVNEMEWFNGWLSLVLWSAICCCLITASIVRIPWRWSRAGAHLTHLGVVATVVTATIYFAYKVEGEALLLRHYIDLASSGGSCRLLPNPGYTQNMGGAMAKVEMVNPHWSVLSGGAAQQAWAVMVSVQFPDGKPFTATLIEDHPELTQYTLQGRQPQSWLSDYPAVVADDGHVSATDAAGRSVLATELRVKARTVEQTAGGERSLEITNITPDFPLMSPGFEGRKATMVEWTLKTPGGQESGSSVIGQPTLTRFQRARLKQVPDARLTSIRLSPAPCAIAYHQSLPALWVRSAAAEADSALEPLREVSSAQVAHFALPGLPRYHDHGRHVPGGAALDLPAGSFAGVDFRITGFAPYAELVSRWIEDPAEPLHPILDISFASPGTDTLNRVLSPSDDPAVLDERPLSWLRAGSAAELAAITAKLAGLFPALAQERPQVGDEREAAAATRIVFLTAPAGALTLYIGQPGRNLAHYDIAPGGEAEVHMWNVALKVKINACVEHPRRLTAPVSVPDEERESRSSVGSFKSYIEVTASKSSGAPGSWSMWVPYTPFPHLPHAIGEADSTLGAYAPHPVHLAIPEVGTFELEYARELLPLPGPLWMTGFNVPRRPGSDDPTEYFCELDYGSAAAPGHATVHMNYPLSWQSMFFFQAGWDPPYQALTVLGVGNRPAGSWLLAAAILLALGMAWSGVTAARRPSPPPPREAGP